MQILFIHGSGSTGNAWQYQSDYFKGSIAIDLPGHPTGNAMDSVSAMAAWLKAYVDQLGISELVLIGHSMGGGIALQYALDYPEDVSGLVLIGSGGRLRVHPDALNFMQQAIATPVPFVSMIEGMGQQCAEPFRHRFRADALALGPAIFLNDFEACDRFDVMERLSTINLPTVAIVGSNDIMTPVRYSEYLCQSMPNATLEIIRGGSHMAFAEYPDKVNAVIGDFLSGTLKTTRKAVWYQGEPGVNKSLDIKSRLTVDGDILLPYHQAWRAF